MHGVAGDLLGHSWSGGMMFVLGWNEASQAGDWRWEEFCAERWTQHVRTFSAAVFQYGDIPVYMRLNLGTDMPGQLICFPGI